MKTAKREIRKPYSPRKRVSLECGEGRTKKSFAGECNINHIIGKYRRTGVLEHVREAIPKFADVPMIDYHQAQNLLVEAQYTFDQLPADMRKECDNDPGKFLQKLHSEDGREFLERYQLAAPKAAPSAPAPKAGDPPSGAPGASDPPPADPEPPAPAPGDNKNKK